MNHFKKILILLVICLTFLGGILFIYISYFGKPLMEAILSEVLHRRVAVGKLSYRPPLSIQAENIYIDGLLEVKKIRAYLEPKSLWKKQIEISHLVLTEAYIGYIDPVKRDLILRKNNAQGVSDRKVSEGVPPSQNKYGFELIVKKLFIKNGKVAYKYNLVEEERKFLLDEVQVRAYDLVLPLKDSRIFFEMTSHIKEGSFPLAGNNFDAKGWINWLKKDMDAQIILTDPTEKMHLKAHVVSLNNDMDVSGVLLLNNVLSNVNLDKLPSQDLSNALSTLKLNVNTNFSFKTKMNDLRVESIHFSGDIEK